MTSSTIDNDLLGLKALVSSHGKGRDVLALKRLLIKAELAQDFIEQLNLVMPADFKDWHDNADSELPEIAAFVIANLRQRLEWEAEETERLRRELIDARFKVKQLGALCDTYLDARINPAPPLFVQSADDIVHRQHLDSAATGDETR